MEVGSQIKKYRMEMGLSQSQLADEIYVSRQTISNWETDKSYPDLKSLVMLSSLFGVTLDVLIKGDLEIMKEKIQDEDMAGFKRSTKVFNILMICMFVTPMPLVRLLGYYGFGIWGVLAVGTLFYAFRVEKLKKALDIQTFKEISAFCEGKPLNEIEKNREIGKRTYQKVLLAIASALIMAILTALMYWVLF